MMNPQRRNLLIVSLCLVAATGVYLPFTGKQKTATSGLRYGIVGGEFAWQMGPGNTTTTDFGTNYFWVWDLPKNGFGGMSYRLDVARLAVEWAFIAVVTVIGFALLSARKRSDHTKHGQATAGRPFVVETGQTTANPHLQDQVYRLVGEEVARNEFHPGPMARAVAESHGNRELVQGLYITRRFEELYRQAELEIITEEQRRGCVTCPRCGCFGRPVSKERGNILLVILLLMLYVIPGLIYAIAFQGYKGVCSSCGMTLFKKV